MLAVNVRKIKKNMTYSTLPLTQSFFPEWGNFLRSNVMLVSEKHVFFFKKRGYERIRKCITSQVSIAWYNVFI